MMTLLTLLARALLLLAMAALLPPPACVAAPLAATLLRTAPLRWSPMADGAPAPEAHGPGPAGATAPQSPVPAATAETDPGQVPTGTTTEARAAWEALLAAALPSQDAVQGPVTGFDLEFDGRVYQERQTNDFSGRYRYLEPGYVHTTLDKSKRVTMRGPDGDWLVFKDGKRVRLEGRDYELDVEDLDRAVGVAQSFVALTDPRTIRIARLDLLGAVPSSIPDRMAKRAAGLDWLLLETPDFRLANDPVRAPGAPATLHRIELGLDRESHLPSLVVVRQSELGPAGFESAQLLQLDDFRRLDGYRVPHQVITYGPDASTSPWTFDQRHPTFDLYVKEGTLRPRHGPSFFRP